MFFLIRGMGVSGLSAGLCFSTGFASGFVEELPGGFESCANVQLPQGQERQIAPIRCTNFMAILPSSRAALSQNGLDDVFLCYDRGSPICGCHFASQSCTTTISFPGSCGPLESRRRSQC